MTIASALPPLNLNPPKPAAPAAANGAAPKSLVPLQSTSSLPPRTPPNQVSIRPLEILQQPSPALSANVETVVSEFAEVFVGHEHIKPKTNSSEKTPLLKLDGLPLSVSAVEEMAAASGAVEEQVVEAMDETHAKKRKGSSSHKYTKMANHIVSIALDVATFIPFAGSVPAGIRLLGYVWEGLNGAVKVAKKNVDMDEPQPKKDSIERAAKVGHVVLFVTGKVLGLIPGLGMIGAAISLVDDVIRLSEDVLSNSFV